MIGVEGEPVPGGGMQIAKIEKFSAGICWAIHTAEIIHGHLVALLVKTQYKSDL